MVNTSKQPLILLLLMLTACGMQNNVLDSTNDSGLQEASEKILEHTTVSQQAEDWKDRRFLKASCGDSLPTDETVYPLALYPVLINFSQDDLNKVKTYFCEDAYKVKKNESGETAIQVGSFVSMENANIFKEFIQDKIGNGELGEAKIFEAHPDARNMGDSISTEVSANSNLVTHNRKLIESAGLSSEQSEILSSLNGQKFPGRGKDNVFNVVLPRHIPSGFYIENFEYEEADKDAVGNDYVYLSYTLTYKDRNNRCFWLNVSTNQGGGEALYQDNVDAVSPDLGKFSLAYTDFDREVESSVVHSGLTYFNGIAHLFTSPSWKNPSGCKGIGVIESVKIVESLTLLTP